MQLTAQIDISCMLYNNVMAFTKLVSTLALCTVLGWEFWYSDITATRKVGITVKMSWKFSKKVTITNCLSKYSFPRNWTLSEFICMPKTTTIRCTRRWDYIITYLHNQLSEGKIKVNSSHKMAWKHTGGVEIQHYSFSNLGVTSGWVVNVTPQLLYPWGMTTYPLDRRLGGPHNCSG
jgi:hypothetical protein